MDLSCLPDLTVSSIRIDYGPQIERTASWLAKMDFYCLNERPQVMVKIGEDALNRSLYDLVVSKDSVQAMATRFPNVKRLTIVVFSLIFREDFDLSSLISLWPNVNELTVLCNRFLVLLDSSQVMSLARSINGLKSLKALTLDLALYQLNLTIFGQLEQLTCKLMKDGATISARRYAAYSRRIIDTMSLFPNIKTMGLWTDALGLDDCPFSPIHSAMWPAQVTNRITRLVLDMAAKPSLDAICAKFGSLTYLRMLGWDRSYYLISVLQSLSQLEHLHTLVIYKALSLAIEEPPGMRAQLPVLESVKRVTFIAPLNPHKLPLYGSFFSNAVQVTFVVDYKEWTTFRGQLCNDEHCANCVFISRSYSIQEESSFKPVHFQFNKSGLIANIIQ